ncbi:MAG: membrane protein insertase YidC [Planctomycetota bacterium]
MPQPQKKFDPIQIAGIGLAVLIFFGGQSFLSAKHAQELAEWRRAQAEAQAELERQQALHPPELKSVNPAPVEAKKTSVVEQQPAAAPQPAEAPEPQDAEPADAGDIPVQTAQLSLVFTAKGAAVRNASLTLEDIDPGNKGKAGKGLDILGEIEKGKLAFDLPKFEIGPPEPEHEPERLKFDDKQGHYKPLNRRAWKLESDSKGFDAAGLRTICYSVTLAQKFVVSKTFTIHQDRAYIECEVGVKNLSSAAVTFAYELFGAPGILLDGPASDPKGGAFVYIVAEIAGRDAPPAGEAPAPEVLPVWPDTAAKGDEKKSSLSKQQNLWGGIKNRFYMAMLVSLDPSQLIRISAVPIANNPNDQDKRLAEPNTGILALRRESESVAPGTRSPGDKYAFYIGPSSERNLSEAEGQLGQPLYLAHALQYCDMFYTTWPNVDRIARVMLAVFHGLSRVFRNYGVAVVLLTLLIKLCLHPLQRKMMISMNRLQKLQPELKKLQEKYKGQTTAQAKQRMFQEQQEIMKKGGASHTAGCLPMFVQLPILTALYGIFNRAFEIRGAEFLWIKDLSQADRLAVFDFFPKELNLLPVLYAVLQFAQMKLAPQTKPTDQQQEMQQKMMTYMPLVFSVMLYRMPAGLMLYFAASAVFGMIESWYIRKYLIKDAPVAKVEAVPVKG